MESDKLGFTMVELLVVISIIGFIASILLISLNVVRAKARDVRRLTDKGAIIKALNLAYKQDWPMSPFLGSGWACLGLLDGSYCARGAYGSTLVTNELLQNMSAIPTPNTGQEFFTNYMYASHVGWIDEKGEHSMGAYLLWMQEVDMTDDECAPHNRYRIWGSYWYCYEFLGP